MSAMKMTESELVSELQSTLGAAYVLADSESRSYYAQDVFTKDIPVVAIAQPANTQELATVVKKAIAAGYRVVARGGGMSYTSGYVPVEQNTITIDMSRMSRVLEINKEDMYVTLECGCTWKSLHEALKGTGLRTPFWGTLSGIKATVGGGLSQNAIFWGSGQFGTAADSVIGLEVVLADGSVVKTGSAAQKNATPFFRHFGPDLTGVFTSDAGALGFKATATLRLIPELPAKQYIAFDFQEAKDALAAMSEIARANLATECFGFDPYLQAQRMKRESLAKDVKALAGVMKSAGSVLGALKEGAKIAMAGRGYMDNVQYSVQIIVEDRIPAAAEARAQAIREIGKRFNAREIENSIPKIARANPFGPVNNMVGPEGERWVPVHAVLPHSKMQAAYEAVVAVFDRYQADLDKHEIGVGYLFATIATNGFALEPVFFWPDAMTEIHQRSIEPDALARMKKFPENLEARAVVKKIRAELVALFSDMGGVHMQIGKAYRYADALDPQALRLVQTLKEAVDPTAQINPGSLGLAR